MEEESKEYRWETGYEKVIQLCVCLMPLIMSDSLSKLIPNYLMCLNLIDMGSHQRRFRWVTGTICSGNDSKSTSKTYDRKKWG